MACFVADTWECTTCTLSNPSSAKSCSACNSRRDDDSSATKGTCSESLGKPNSSITHKTLETVGVEAKRIHDESQAREQWQNIVKICFQVRSLFWCAPVETTNMCCSTVDMRFVQYK